LGLQSILQRFLQLDEKLHIKPDVKSWTISEDAKTYTFTLAKDVYFQKHILFGTDNLRTVNASDFEYSL
jgi:peptide/nickel transport system substrate-binding protein